MQFGEAYVRFDGGNDSEWFRRYTNIQPKNEIKKIEKKNYTYRDLFNQLKEYENEKH
jgi:hypothetical protein